MGKQKGEIEIFIEFDISENSEGEEEVEKHQKDGHESKYCSMFTPKLQHIFSTFCYCFSL